MRHVTRALAVGLVLTGCLRAATAGAQVVPADRKEADARWSVEFLGGPASLDPSDLNARSTYLETVESNYYGILATYNTSVYGRNFSYSLDRTGAFARIHGAWTGEVRVGYRVTPRLTLLGGFEYLSRSRSTSFTQTYSYTLVDPDSMDLETRETVTETASPFLLSTRAYTASAGLAIAVLRWRPISVEAVGRGGVAWARCRQAVEIGTSTTFYRTHTSTSLTMSGRGTTGTAEGGFRARWRLSRRWSVLAEASYLRQRFSNVTGSQQSRTTRQDGDATSVELEDSSSANGRWRMVPVSSTVYGHTFQGRNQVISGSEESPFTLDLSGRRLRVGVAFGVF